MLISYLHFVMDYFNQLIEVLFLFLNIWLRSEFQEMGTLMSHDKQEVILVWGI